MEQLVFIPMKTKNKITSDIIIKNYTNNKNNWNW